MNKKFIDIQILKDYSRDYSHLHCEITFGALLAALVSAFQHGNYLVHRVGVHAQFALLLQHGNGMIQVGALSGRPQGNVLLELHVHQGGGYLGFGYRSHQILFHVLSRQDLKSIQRSDPVSLWNLLGYF